MHFAFKYNNFYSHTKILRKFELNIILFIIIWQNLRRVQRTSCCHAPSCLVRLFSALKTLRWLNVLVDTELAFYRIPAYERITHNFHVKEFLIIFVWKNYSYFSCERITHNFHIQNYWWFSYERIAHNFHIKELLILFIWKNYSWS